MDIYSTILTFVISYKIHIVLHTLVHVSFKIHIVLDTFGRIRYEGIMIQGKPTVQRIH